VFAQRLASYPAWPELADLGDCPACEVPPQDRPAIEPDRGAAFSEQLTDALAKMPLASAPKGEVA